MQLFGENYEENVHLLDDLTGAGRSFDVVSRDLLIGGRRAKMYVIDGYSEGVTLERMTSVWLAVSSLDGVSAMKEFIDRYVTHSEVETQRDADVAVRGMLIGKTLLIIDGFLDCALIDAKTYPMRGVEEPSSGKVLLGSHDGFVETLVFNAALLRRRICDPKLTLEAHKVSERSETNVVLCYLEDKVDRRLLSEVRDKLKRIDVSSVAMSQESIAEAMMKGQWYNPFPRVRYTERPDAATACVMEGEIVLMVDNSPAVMILPTRFFDFLQEANDYYFPPLVGSYLRILRMVIFFLTLFITPLWYWLIKNPHILAEHYHFIEIRSETTVPIFVQLLLVEFLVDLLKLASLNTPNAFAGSFSTIGALVLGDFAVQARWLVPEVLAYMAFVAVANFAQPSYELSYAFKLLRLLLLCLIAALDTIGFVLGIVLIVFLLFTTKPIAGREYMSPLWPFDAKALLALVTRRPIRRDNT